MFFLIISFSEQDSIIIRQKFTSNLLNFHPKYPKIGNNYFTIKERFL